MVAGRVSLVLDELDELETGVEETVDAVGETGLFGAREAGRRRASHTPGLSSITAERGAEDSKHVLVPAHAGHFVDGLLDTGLGLFLLDELGEFLLEGG